MRCNYHPNATPRRIESERPKWMSGVYEKSEMQRIMLRCPLCPWVAEEARPERQRPKQCARCGCVLSKRRLADLRKKAEALGMTDSDSLRTYCKPCSQQRRTRWSEYNKRRYAEARAKKVTNAWRGE